MHSRMHAYGSCCLGPADKFAMIFKYSKADVDAYVHRWQHLWLAGPSHSFRLQGKMRERQPKDS